MPKNNSLTRVEAAAGKNGNIEPKDAESLIVNPGSSVNFPNGKVYKYVHVGDGSYKLAPEGTILFTGNATVTGMIGQNPALNGLTIMGMPLIGLDQISSAKISSTSSTIIEDSVEATGATSSITQITTE